MLAVHALWSPDRGLVLWAEDGERPATTASRARRGPRAHPFAVPASALAALHPGRAVPLTLHLPARASGPLGSPELVRARPVTGRGAVRLEPWSVPGVVVDPAELADPADGAVRYGASVTHLRAVAAFAAELAGRGRVLPALAREATAAWARWRPVVRGLDRAALESLVAAQPPVARAERPAADPAELVGGALAALTDAAVRDRFARADTPPRLVPRRGPAAAGGRAVEAWLAALTGQDGRVDAEPRALVALAAALEPWDAVGTEPVGAARACFRLAEVPTLHDPADPGPDPLDATGDGTRWRLEFLLRSTADPSLLLTAEQVWSGGAERLVAGAQEVLLAELGRAARLYPPLAAALRTGRPTALDLTAEGAHEVLTDTAARLVEAGYGVLLPAGWDGRRGLGLRLSVRSTPTAGVVVRGGLGREQVAEFRWSLAVAGEVLDEEEIAELVAAKAPLVRLRGSWVSVDTERLRRGLEFLRRARERPAPPTVAEVLALLREHLDAAAAPLPVTAVDARGWVGDLLAGRAEQTLAPVPAPPGLHAVLRPYQRRGLSWLAFLSALGLGACLADDMGLGKTVQLLALEAHERALPARGATPADGPAAPVRPPPTLLVCPLSLVGTWEREAARFTPGLRVLVHHGPGRPRGAALAEGAAAADLVVTTYATAVRDADDLAAVGWHRLVLDEAQNVKNSASAPATAVRRIPAGHRVALTGTPVENRLAELWSIMDLLNPGLLGGAERFRTRYAVPIERHGDAEAARRLRRITRPYLLRRVKTDPAIIDDLPDKIEITQHYRLTREQASLYRTVVDDMLARIGGADGMARRGTVLAALAKLKQVCNHPAQLLHDGSPVGRRSGKVTRLEELLAEILAEGDRALCFTQYVEFGELVLPHLAARLDTDIAFLHGGVSKARRDALVARFQEGAGPPVLLLSLKAGGTGLTLTAANHVLHLDRWWNPAVEDQATDRAYRIGQRRTVQVRKFVCPGTVEERIDALIRSKRALAERVVGTGEGWLTELSTEALRELMALDAEAAVE